MSETRNKGGCQVVAPDLNPVQLEAVTHRGGPLLVVAGPGTGKTRVLTCRLAHLLESGVARPEQILAITFTNQAAGEIRQRVATMLGGVPAPQVATFHGWALRFLQGVHGPNARLTIDEEDARLLCHEAAGALGIAGGRRRDMYKRLSRAKQHWPPATMEGDAELSALYEAYQALLARHGLWDYDDLLLETLHILQEPDRREAFHIQTPFLLVDEFQDVNPVQYALVRAMTRLDGEVMVIGDPDQAIYGFRGASPAYVQRFAVDFVGVRHLRLGTAYRSPQAFLDAASAVVESEGALSVRSVRSRTVSIRVRALPDATSEARWVARTIEKVVGGLSYDALDRGLAGGNELRSLSDVGVLYRINALGQPLAEALAAAGIPFQQADKPHLLSIPEVRAVWRLWEALAGRQTAYHLERLPGGGARWANRLTGLKNAIIGLPPQEVVRRLIEALGFDPQHPALRAVVRAASRWSDMDSPALKLRHAADMLDTALEAVSLLSIHAAKGLEFPVVFIVGCEEGLLPWPESDPEEERRLFYVGLTRASEQLYVSHVRARRFHGRSLPGRPSPFLARIPANLLAKEESIGPRKPRRPKQRTLF